MPVKQSRTVVDYQFGSGADGFISIPYFTGAGYIYETGGLLVMGCNAGSNMDWRAGNFAYAAFGSPRDEDYAIIAETELSSASLTGNNQAWFGLWQDDSNNVWWYCEDAGGVQYCYQIINGTWTSLATGPTMALPAKLRIVWEPHRNRFTWYAYVGGVWTQYYTGQLTIKPTRAFLYARNYSGTPATEARWNYLTVTADAMVRPLPIPTDREDKTAPSDVARLIPVTTPPGRFKVGTHQNQYSVPVGIGQPQARPDQPVGPQDRASFQQDANAWPPVTGPKRHTYPMVSEAVVLPGFQKNTPASLSGPTVQREGDWTRDVSIYPTRSMLRALGKVLSRTHKWNAPGEPYHSGVDSAASVGGVLFSGGFNKANATDECKVNIETDVLDWAAGVFDADGHEFVQGVGLRSLVVGSTVGEPWDSPVAGDGYMGAGRDGQFYYDGNPTGPSLNGTSFGTLIGGFNYKTWMFDVEPNAIASSVANPTMSLFANDTVRFVGTNMNTGNIKWASSRFRWCLIGDFDIQIDWANYTGVGGTDGGAMFMAHIGAAPDASSIPTCFYVRRWGLTAGGRIDSNVHINGGTGNYVSVTTSTTSGKSRLVRVGSTVRTYYWSGAAWVLLRSDITNVGLAVPMCVSVYMDGYGNKSSTCDFSAFTINSGTAFNTAGWTREAAGTHRGSLATFPQKYALVGTATEVSIIDVTTNKLWMRFLLASQTALHPWSANTRPFRCKMYNGTLYISMTDVAGNGAAVRVEFNQETIQVHRTAADANTGSFLRSYDGNYWAPLGLHGRDVGPQGIISSRNQAGGWSPDLDYNRILSNQVWDVDLTTEASWRYWAVATASGPSVFGWRELYMDGVANNGLNRYSPRNIKHNLATHVYWCWIDPSSRDLYYASATTIYRATKANYQAQLIATPNDGDLTPTDAIALPACTISVLNQRYLVVDGTSVYLASDEGIWRFNPWPSGSWTLLYGDSASAALFKILPLGYKVCSISGPTYDGLTKLMLVQLENGWRSLTGAIKLNSNALYGIVRNTSVGIESRGIAQAV